MKLSGLILILFFIMLCAVEEGTADCECKCSDGTTKYLAQPPAKAPSNQLQAPKSSPKPEPGGATSPRPSAGKVKNCWEAHSSSTSCHPEIREFLTRNQPISIICCTLFVDIHEDCSTSVPHYFRKVYEHCTHRKRA